MLDAYIVYFPPCPVEITSLVARYDKKCHMGDAVKKSEEVREGKKERRSSVKREHGDEEKEEGTKNDRKH